MTAKRKISIRYSCYFNFSRAGEQFSPTHTIGYVVSGAFELNDGKTTQLYKKGDVYFCKRNSLLKYAKEPPENGEFRSISISFDEEFLRRIGVEYNFSVDNDFELVAFQSLPSNSILSHFMESLAPYEQVFNEADTDDLLMVKQKEAILLLLQIKPELKNVLFNFTDPGKIDLGDFMNQNFHFNVQLIRFAYLTGRSLSTFKRDFEKQFNTTPSRWLLKRRLQEAYYLLEEKGRAVTDIYLDLGFEDLSHFSFAFKKQFGLSPSELKKA